MPIIAFPNKAEEVCLTQKERKKRWEERKVEEKEKEAPAILLDEI